MDSGNFTTFIKRPPCMTDAQEKFLYTKELLSGRIFLAQYEEKRYVPVLKDYRDVVVINPEETELLHELDKIRSKWLGVQDLKWVGITGPEDFGFPKAHCLWVKLTNLAMGQYWFQIKHVKLVDQEIVYQLKCIRKFQAPLRADTPEKKNKRSDTKKGFQASTSVNTSSFNTDIDAKKVLSSFQESCFEAINTIQPYITWKNFFTVIKVGCALLIALIVGIIQMTGHLGNFVLKLIREITFLVNAFTPIAIQLIDFFTKIIGGLFILVAALFRSGNHRNHLQYSQILYSHPASFQPTPVDWRERNRILRQELLSSSGKNK